MIFIWTTTSIIVVAENELRHLPKCFVEVGLTIHTQDPPDETKRQSQQTMLNYNHIAFQKKAVIQLIWHSGVSDQLI